MTSTEVLIILMGFGGGVDCIGIYAVSQREGLNWQ